MRLLSPTSFHRPLPNPAPVQFRGESEEQARARFKAFLKSPAHYCDVGYRVVDDVIQYGEISVLDARGWDPKEMEGTVEILMGGQPYRYSFQEASIRDDSNQRALTHLHTGETLSESTRLGSNGVRKESELQLTGRDGKALASMKVKINPPQHLQYSEVEELNQFRGVYDWIERYLEDAL